MVHTDVPPLYAQVMNRKKTQGAANQQVVLHRTHDCT